MTIDTSNISIGVVLSQYDKLIAFYSKKMFHRMKNSSSYICELFDITESVTNGDSTYKARSFISSLTNKA